MYNVLLVLYVLNIFRINYFCVFYMMTTINIIFFHWPPNKYIFSMDTVEESSIINFFLSSHVRTDFTYSYNNIIIVSSIYCKSIVTRITAATIVT